MRRVYLASPLSGDVERNLTYARRCLADSLARGEAPFVPHLLYTQTLDDTKPEDRALGMQAGNAWRGAADAIVLCIDFGISDGMQAEMAQAVALGLDVEARHLGEEVSHGA